MDGTPETIVIHEVLEVSQGLHRGSLVIELVDGRLFFQYSQPDGAIALRQMGVLAGNLATGEELLVVEAAVRVYLIGVEPIRVS